MNPSLLLAGALALQSSASDSLPTPVRVGPLAASGFIDVYYAYDFGRPASRERGFVTQAVRHNEVNLNLAHVAFTLERSRIRGRLALQVGTAVQANYAAEPAIGANSGASLSRHVQEAAAGVRLANPLWLDAGILLGYLGWEGWISRDNPTYTRSLVAELTPYYESGVRLTWQPSKGLTVQGHLMNGWQKISEDNGSKAFGIRVDYSPVASLTLAYGGFVGNERPDGLAPATRLFNQLMARILVSDLLLQMQFDYGREGRGAALRDWYGAVVIARLTVTPHLALSTRLERFADPDQVVAITGSSMGLVVSGGSLGWDVAIPGGMLWRTEFRGLRASQRLFPKAGAPNATRRNGVLVTSIALTL
jgi:hypothetical protein